MESDRLAKRRKVEVIAPADRAASAEVARETWRVARLQAQAEKHTKLTRRRSKPIKDPSDVYDDIEAAHQTPRAKSRHTENGKPSKASKHSPGLGFFKRFTEIKSVSEDGDDGEGDESEEGGLRSDGEHDSEPSIRPNARPRRFVVSRADEANGHGLPTSKTFEEQIKDVEAAARSQAAEEQGTPGSASQRQPKKEIVREPSIVNSPIACQPKRKRGRPPKSKPVVDISHSQSTADHQDNTLDNDRMEIDDSENDARHLPRPDLVPISTPIKKPFRPVARSPLVFQSETTKDEIAFQFDQLQAIQTAILQRATGKRPIRLADLEDEYAKVSSLISQTVSAGESNSMLLIGARGSGKTALVNQILAEQVVNHPQEFLVVRLNGFIHTDDKIALREIWRQLGCEMELDEAERTTKNYADTLTTLLALLSHPAETGQDQQPGQVTKSVIFVLDEFELFASHPRQTLLYNLFDVAQSRKAPIAVLGLTTRVDVAESLEKRVKSRFSHRYVHLSLSKSYLAFQQACQSAMTVGSDDLPVKESAPNLKELSLNPLQLADKWNMHVVGDLIASTTFTDHLHRIYYTTKSIPDFLSSLLLPLATLPATPSAIISHFTTHLTPSLQSPPDSKLALLPSLSVLHLALLICAARLHAIHATEAPTFPLVYEEYQLLASKAKLQATASGNSASARISTKDVARDVWSELLEAGLVMEVVDARRGEAAGRLDVALQEIGACGVDLGGWGKWCKEI